MEMVAIWEAQSSLINQIATIQRCHLKYLKIFLYYVERLQKDPNIWQVVLWGHHVKML